MEREQILKKITQRLKKEGARRVVMFGSYARHEEKSQSDIDIIVQFSRPKGLLDMARIERELSEEVRTKVDLLTEKSISPLIREQIRGEEVVLYG
mgnify:CR=1 FL=1